MRAAILSIGTELMRGDIVDTNSTFLARELGQLGFDVVGIESVPDTLDRLTEAVTRARSTTSVTLTTGGLGPTEDDLTRDAIAASLDEELYVDQSLVDEIEARFASMRRRMPVSNHRQAMLIPSARPLRNYHGTAPGWLVERDGFLIVAMPGPPKEMQPMWCESVSPRLERLLPGHGHLAMLSLMTFGLGESAVEERVQDVIHRREDVTVATYAKEAGVQVHASARAASAAEVNELIEETAELLHQRLGDAIYGRGDETLSGVVGAELARRGLTLGVMESATGGELASTVTDTAGSSEYFRGGIVAYTGETKEAFGVDGAIMEQFGLISAETAESMAAAARRRLHTDIGLGVTGIAGIDAVEGKLPGTCFVAVSMDGVETSREIHRPASREIAKRFFAQSALDLLRRRLTIRESAPA